MSEGEHVSDFEFDGNWREFAAIALPNLLLTLATLGLYRFWATTRVRRYLWSRTIFMGDRLEWAGTGRELSRSGLMALVVVLLPLSVINLAIRFLTNHGYDIAGQSNSPQMGMAAYLNSHPDPASRATAFGAAFRTNRRYRAALSGAQFEAIRTACAQDRRAQTWMPDET